MNRFSNQVRFDWISGNVPSVVVVLLQVHGSSEERRGAAEETESAGSLPLHSLRYTHTHTHLPKSPKTPTNNDFDYSVLLVGINVGNHDSEMTSSRSHGKIQAEFPRL